MTGSNSARAWRSRREFLRSSAAVAAGAYGLSPSFALAAPVPEKFDGSAFTLKGKRPVAATLRRDFPSLMLGHGRRAGDAGAGRSAKDQS